MEAMLLLIGLGAGFVAAWFLRGRSIGGELALVREQAARELASRDAEVANARAQGEREKAALEKARADDARAVIQREREWSESIADLQSKLRVLSEHNAILTEANKKMSEHFKAVAGDALTLAQKQFLELAKQSFETQKSDATAQLEERKKAVETLLKPVTEALTKLEKNTVEIEQKREGAYQKVTQQIEQLAGLAQGLQRETTTLSTALRDTRARGRWGEIALRNIAELAGMLEHCDFEEQETTGDRKRPDMVVNLPNSRKIAIDAKVPLDAYMRSIEATDEAGRKVALDEHVKAVEAHVKALSARDYAAGLAGEIDMVVLFLPSDALMSAAFGVKPDLQVNAWRAKVLIATPTTLVALLRTVAFSWSQRQIEENAQQIVEVATDLYQRTSKFTEFFKEVGVGLGNAVTAYNGAVGSYKRRVVPAGRRIEALYKEVGGKGFASIAEIEPTLRELTKGE